MSSNTVPVAENFPLTLTDEQAEILREEMFRYAKYLCRVQGVKNAEDAADDIVQRTYLRAMKSCNPAKSVKAYIRHGVFKLAGDTTKLTKKQEEKLEEWIASLTEVSNLPAFTRRAIIAVFLADTGQERLTGEQHIRLDKFLAVPIAVRSMHAYMRKAIYFDCLNSILPDKNIDMETAVAALDRQAIQENREREETFLDYAAALRFTKKRLNEEEQEIVVRRMFGQTCGEIAKVQKTTIGNITSRIHRIREKAAMQYA